MGDVYSVHTDFELAVLLFKFVVFVTVAFWKLVNSYLVLFNLLQNLQKINVSRHPHRPINLTTTA